MSLCLAAIPAASAANIDDITIQQNVGTWSTDGSWSIAGITDIGSPANPLLNTAPSYTSIIIPCGTYLIFLGYEPYWYGSIAGNTATITLYYDDSSTKSARFTAQNLSCGTVSWIRTSGDALYFGASGYTAYDRVGDGVAAISPNSINDAVLVFSDTADFGSPSGPNPVPEPATCALVFLGMAPILLRRARRR